MGKLVDNWKIRKKNLENKEKEIIEKAVELIKPYGTIIEDSYTKGDAKIVFPLSNTSLKDIMIEYYDLGFDWEEQEKIWDKIMSKANIGITVSYVDLYINEDNLNMIAIRFNNKK